jgi:RNA polymerase sigma factor (sigma-70 family)
LKNLLKKKIDVKTNPKDELEAIQICMPFILKTAHKWTRNHRSYFQDFVSEGYCGVLEAFKRYKGTKYEEQGYRFSSYAWLWIRVYQRELAMKTWKFMNNTQQENEVNMDNESYEMNVDHISAKMEFDKLDLIDQELVLMKMEGHTFEEIAESKGFQNLHKARARYIELCEKISA